MNSSCPIHLVALPPDSIPAPTHFDFQFPPERIVLGDPGKTAGDILLIRDQHQSRVLVSLGPRDKAKPETWRKAGGQAGKWLRDNPPDVIDLDINLITMLGGSAAIQPFLEGLRLGSYTFNTYKTKEKVIPPIMVRVNADDRLVDRITILTEAVMFSRDLAHEPANVINPITFAHKAQTVVAPVGLKIQVLDEQELDAIGAGAILSVGKGSQTPPRLIIIEYQGAGSAKGTPPVLLIGKALTFDSGGYSLKDSANIQGMKYDKCGGAIVLATIMAAAQLEIKQPVVAIIGAAENMISGQAYRPDDILHTLSGKTVEIVTTDAEGRLVLADALTFAQQKYTPRAIIDLATLTGGVVVALGRIRAGIMGNDQNLINSLVSAGDATNELVWQLPLDDDYLQATKGDDADLKNSGGREGHPIMGGIFLKQFVADSVPWAHIDIAGVADTPKDSPYAPKGATGFGVRLLVDYLNSLE